MFVHEQNLKTKIDKDYNSLAAVLQEFYDHEYLPMRENLLSIEFGEDKPENFEIATAIFNDYYDKLRRFSKQHNISSQSKFESTYLEEMSVYLFHRIPQLQSRELGIYNKRIFAGLKISQGTHIDVITKDVDFCIGRQITIKIDNGAPKTLVIPVVAVEVKTFLDATMFGEVKSSSRAIRNATPNAQTFVLMGFRNLADVHIIAARNDSALNEMFALRRTWDSPMEATVIAEYWREIVAAVNSVSNNSSVPRWGKLLKI